MAVTPRDRSRMVGKAGRLALVLAALLFASLAWAQSQLTFPALTGRVVDGANIIAPERRSAIEAKLAAHEAKTSDQVVVATVSSLQGTAVEDYANRLFREWKLGEAKTDNGVLLLVAPNERKVRIEVGYGLEGALTDALSKVIITTAITPKFKTGDFAGGIEAGIDGILAILSRDADEWQRRAKVREDQPAFDAYVPFIIMAIILAIFVTSAVNGARRGRKGARWHRTRNGGWVVVPDTGINWGGASSGGSGWGGGGGWSSGSSGGGFSGGGGSSGGGGASGDW
ncbi:MAG: TPM domain-containing protein [Bosea sp. (in: a-proteobacteria)]